MGNKTLLLVLCVALFTSCSTYKAGQTPDDVYYSPAKEVVARVQKETKRDRYEEYISAEDDRYLRMKIQNRDRWSELDDYSYWNDSRFFDCNSFYAYNNAFIYNSPNANFRYNGSLNNIYSNNMYNYSGNNLYNYRYNNCASTGFNRTNFFGYGGLYSPLYPVVYYKSPKVYTGSTGKANLSTYRNPNYNNSNYYNSKGNSTQSFGNMMKRVFSDPAGSNSSSGSWDRPVRTFESGTTTSSSAGGKSGGYNSTGSSTETKRGPR